MLRISKKADYAVFLLGAIAREGAYPGGPAADSVVSAHEIARRAGLNKSVVANLLKDFAKHGVLDSVRGLKGGYRLIKPPQQVSLHDILEVVEGKFTLVECIAHQESAARDDGSSSGLLALARTAATDTEHGCSLYSFCPSKRPMHVVHDRMSRLFREIRLDELCSLDAAAPPAKITTR